MICLPSPKAMRLPLCKVHGCDLYAEGNINFTQNIPC